MLRFDWLNSLRSLMFNSTGKKKPFGKRRVERAALIGRPLVVSQFVEALEWRELLATIDVVSNVLEIKDLGGNSDALTISCDTVNGWILISDPSNPLLASVGSGSGSNSVTVPLSAFSGGISVQTADGNDSLTINLSAGNFGRSITYQGGVGTDVLTVTGVGTFATVTHGLTNATDGTIDVTANSQISYSGLDSSAAVTDNLSATARVFTGNAVAETITVTDATNANMTIASTSGAAVTFANPLSSLTINAGAANDTVTITSLDTAYAGSLTINGDGDTDIVTLTPAISIDSLSVDSETINVNGGTITTSGAQSYTGSVHLGAATTIAGSAVSFTGTVDGGYALVVNASGATLFSAAV
ncbi:MAG: hypothetical protein WCK86_16620, partial [Planctomycetia bacterium]